MKVSVLCSSALHPVYPHLEARVKRVGVSHDIEVVQKKAELSGGDILLLISCHEIISAQDRQRYRASLVIHASDVPEGRGWSPHIWQVLEGKRDIVVSMIEAEDEVDTGPIWAQRRLTLEGHELCDEINETLFAVELDLMDEALERVGRAKPVPLRALFECEIGLSDHTFGIGASVASIALGASVIEKHFTLARADGGVDSTFSMEPAEMASLVVESERAWLALGEVHYGLTEKEKQSMIFHRSLYVAEDLAAGEALTEKNLRIIRLGLGLPPKYSSTLIGKRVDRAVRKGTPMSWDLLTVADDAEPELRNPLPRNARA